MLKHCKELFNHGFAIHWLKQASKQPIESGWTKGPRKTWEELRKSYTYGNNVGVRLGKASQLSDGSFLAVIDCDVKSGDAAHCKEMETKLGELLKGAGNAPRVTSGRGNGSRHIYVRTKEPVSPFRFGQSAEKVRVLMPSVKATKNEIATLDSVALKEGYRLRAAWEISVMGEGQQVVLPPSIHPDTKVEYSWEILVQGVESIPLIELAHAPKANAAPTMSDFNAEEVDLVSSELPDTTVEMILSGEGCTDRSAGLFTACVAMVKARFTDNQILSVLTDRETFLGGTAYEHTKSNSRKRAAEWVHKFTLAKVRQETSAAYLFADAVQVSDLDENGVLKQSDELAPPHVDGSWQLLIERGSEKSGARPLPTLKNVVLILTHAVRRDAMKYDAFAIRAHYGADTPWGGVNDVSIGDIDLINVKLWLSRNYRFEPSTNLVLEAMRHISEANSHHPVRDYLDSLTWDGVPRLDTWLFDYSHAEGSKEYVSAVGAKTLMAMVKRIYQPGCKFDNVLILEGEQGSYKSTVVKSLAGDWFTDGAFTIGDKDAVLILQGKWVVELGELSTMNRADIDQLKQFISQSTDRIRKPFDKLPSDMPRQSIFIGTTNSSEYLKDNTGNRRFWPVKVGECDHEGLAKVRDQLFAEAKAALDLGGTLYLGKALEEIARNEQGGRLFEDAWVDEIKKFFSKEQPNFPCELFTIAEMFSEFGLFPHSELSRANQMRLADCLRLAGFEKKRVETKGIRSWKWFNKKQKKEKKHNL